MKRSSPMKQRNERSGVHFFDRQSGLHVLMDEFCVPRDKMSWCDQSRTACGQTRTLCDQTRTAIKSSIDAGSGGGGSIFPSLRLPACRKWSRDGGKMLWVERTSTGRTPSEQAYCGVSCFTARFCPALKSSPQWKL